ncbi:MAG TPA: hypothetical protein DCP66_03715 [Collinsella sp.]|nr:hypothetical protein [Collinsella sp.]
MSADPRHGDRRSFFRHNRLHLFPSERAGTGKHAIAYKRRPVMGPPPTCLVDAYADESIDAVTTP